MRVPWVLAAAHGLSLVARDLGGGSSSAAARGLPAALTSRGAQALGPGDVSSCVYQA